MKGNSASLSTRSNGQPRPEDSPGRGCRSAAEHSAKGPVSRILSCAVIPLGAALPRTLISDLPGGFGPCMEHPCGAGPAPGALTCSGRAPPSLFGLAPCGVYPAPAFTGRAVRSCRTISPLPRRWRFRNGERYPASRANSGLAFPGRPSTVRKRGSRGGIFSVALAVREP